MSAAIDLSLWRVPVVRTLAWALLLTGWVGLGSWAQTLATGPVSAFAALAGWLLALGAFADLIGRLALSPWALRALLISAAVLAARALVSPSHGGGLAALFPAMLAWAIVVVLASSVVRTCRLDARTRHESMNGRSLAALSSPQAPTPLAPQFPPRSLLQFPPPIAPAAGGALLAWACVGDISDLNALSPRLTIGVLAASLLLALLLPQRQGAPGSCRSGLFDCSLPGWQAAGWRLPRRWPVLLASLVMLPMMCSLPLMVSLCRSESVSPQAVLGVHFAAMFLPALLIVRHPWAIRAAPRLCGVLLALGGLGVLFAPGAFAWWALALAHGAAWSAAWATQLVDPDWQVTAHRSPLAGATLNAAWVLLLGVGVALAGLQALTGWHIALGVAGALAAVTAPWLRWRALPST